ncbi:alginate export family protein [Wenzhouxiangella sp. XN79A]|uniref:alginate export family protein n=1 Tax=Wenzhouxiangella sp. XN79A TaxID=2724193 RepID=UPI00144AD477|nr:alginate export family protein [Wenzhouxiangella sp. XN79A]NKI35365.1 alginate export family protein [Wenzhouxiangella sp. XN79A]
MRARSRSIEHTISTLALVALLGGAPVNGFSESGWFADARYRYEWVDESSFDDNARASTLRSRLGYRTADRPGVQFLAEGSNVVALGADEYNAGAGATPGRDEFPVVADPEDTRLARAWVGWRWDSGLDLRAGRQRIELEDDRFIGNVGWRQNEQTYDGLTTRYSGDGWGLFYGWIGRVNRIFDSEVPAGRNDHRTHLLHLRRELTPRHRVAGYLYRIEDREQPALSNRTVGLRYSGSGALRGVAIHWLVEAALQSDTGSRAPVDYSAEYFRLQLAADAHPWVRPKLGLERLGGSDRPGHAFRTPLATLHAFNGWADRFLTTPDAGLDDLYAGFEGREGRWSWQLTGHEFRAEQGSERYGREIDASVAVKLFGSASLLLKAARFERESPAFRSVTKVWAQFAIAWP